MQFSDTHSDAGSGNGPVIGRSFDGVGDHFVRAWWRVTPQTGDDQNISFMSQWNPSTSSINNICFNQSGQFVAPLASFPLDAGFHPIETSGRNMGSAVCASSRSTACWCRPSRSISSTSSGR